MPSIFSGLDPISSSSGSSLSSQDQEKLNKLKTDGDGTKFLNDKLQYVEVGSGNADIDDSTPASDKVYSSQKVEDEFAKKSDIDVDNIKKEVEDSVKTDFFSKQENKEYIDSKIGNFVEKEGTKGLSQNDFSDAYKQRLDDLQYAVTDKNYIHSENNFSNYYKNKIDSLTGSCRYVGLFDDLNARDSYSEPLVDGYWCTVNSDSSHENKRTKYYYSNGSWIFDGLYNSSEVVINDNSTNSTSETYSANKINTELNKKVDNTEITEINNKLDKKLENTDIVAGNNIDIEILTDNKIKINSTTSSSSTTGGTSNYELLSNKPRINNISIIGNKTSKDLGLLDISYASEVNENSVKMADKAKEIDIENQLDGNAKYYGVASGGTDADNILRLRPFPVGLATERIETLTFDILTKDVPQSIPFVREIPTVNCFVQAFKQEDTELNITDVFEDYNNKLVCNHSENVFCGDNGLYIKDEYKIDSRLNAEGLYETDIINRNDFIEIVKIKEAV